jgi:hypothetical protein
MWKLDSVILLVCGISLTLASASVAGAGDKATDYLKDGKLRERVDIYYSGTGPYIVVEPDGSWALGKKEGDKRVEDSKGKLTQDQLLQLAKALAQHNLTNLPNHTCKKESVRSFIISFGKKSVTFSGRPDSKEDEQIMARYHGIEQAAIKLIVPDKKK